MSVDHILKVLVSQPGIQRDGTKFNSTRYIDGQWVRFYMDLPSKIGGYTLTDEGSNEIVRNMFIVDKTQSFDLYLGRPSSLSFVNVTRDGNVSPEIDRTPIDFVASNNNQWTFDLYTVLGGAPTIPLSNDPLTTDGSTSTVVVSITNTSGLLVGDIVTIFGATDTGGISAANLNITAQITAIVPNISFSFTANQVSNSPTTGGGANVSYGTGKSITYICAVATQTSNDINSSIESLIYWGDINATTPLVPISSSNQTTSGGIVCLYPYFFKYGTDGVVTFTKDPGGTWLDAVSTALPVAGVKIVKGLRTRGGSNAPAGLFWSLDSLVRASFVGGALVFQFDNIQDNISVLSSNSICTQDNIFYWVGNKQFYFYNGVVGEIPNDTNKLFFFNNINKDQQQKCWAMVCPYYHELIISFPFGNATECTNILFFEYQKNYWYDSILSRSSGLPPSSVYNYPIMSDANRSIDQNIPNQYTTIVLSPDPISTTLNSSTVTVTVPTTIGLLNGDIISLEGVTSTGGFTTNQLNGDFAVTILSGTTFSINMSSLATSSATGGGNAVMYTFTSNLTYPIWTHEIGTDQVAYGNTLAIDSYFETHITTFFDQNLENDRQMRIRRIEQDFVITENMNLIVNSRRFAQSPVSSSNPYIFSPEQPIIVFDKIDTINMGRLVSFRFQSNTAGGFYQMGKNLLSYSAGDVYP